MHERARMMEPVLEASWIDLDTVAARGPILLASLGIADVVRAASLRMPRDRRRCVARRAWLRQRLSELLGLPPRDIPIVVDRWGKPRVSGEAVAFSVSHAGGVALLVTGRIGPVGCDIEWRNPHIEAMALAARFFAPVESATLAALSPDRRLDGFYCGWTRKEAYVKAIGRGLSIPLDSFAVEIDPDRPARLLAGCDGWSVASFEPRPGFQAAIVGRGAWGLTRRCGEYEPGRDLAMQIPHGHLDINIQLLERDLREIDVVARHHDLDEMP